MPAPFFELSDLNPLHFTDDNLVIDSKYRSKHIDDWQFEPTIFPWMQYVTWFQPWQKSDSIRLQIKSQVGPIRFILLSIEEAVVYSANMVQKQRDRFQSDRFIYECDVPLAAFNTGYYIPVLEFGSPTVVARFIGNTIVIDDEFSDTVLAEYHHYKYFGNIYFESGFRPMMRFYGSLPYDKPGSKNTMYENQQLDMLMLTGKPFNTWRLYAGGPEGVPDFLIPKLNAIVCCSELRIEGRLYAKASEGTNFEKQEETDYPMHGWSIELRSRFNRLAKVYEVTGTGGPGGGGLPGNAGNSTLVVVINVENLGFIQDDGGGNFEQVLDLG